LSPDTPIDERFAELAAQLRLETPAMPERARREVLATTAAAAPPQTGWFSPRRLAVLAVPAAVGLSLALALVVGLNSALSGPRSDNRAASAKPTASTEQLEWVAPSEDARDSNRLRSTGPAPTGGRAQDYSATLRLLVDGTDDLSATTQRALRTARRLGGYVVSVEYLTPEPGEGSAAIRLRIPVSRVQAASVQFSGLGRILAQETRISDLQQPLDDLTRQIRRIQERIAQLRVQLGRPNISSSERARLEKHLASARNNLAGLRRERTEINRRAAYATVALDLTTQEPRQPEATPGRLRRALDDAVGILAAELAIAAYALIVASPFLLLLAAGFFGSRAYRRHADQRLLERA